MGDKLWEGTVFEEEVVVAAAEAGEMPGKETE